MSSPHDVIEVVIEAENKKTPADNAGVGLEKFQAVRTDRVLQRGGRLTVGC